MTTAHDAAEALGMGFLYHDRGDYHEAIEQFAIADTFVFPVAEWRTYAAAVGYAAALWQKDVVEADHDGPEDAPPAEHDAWDAVRTALRFRAFMLGADPAYADLTTTAWARHKRGGDYWTPLLEAQTHEIRAALQDPDYPRKARHGQQGPGPLPALYLFGVELHDCLAMHDEPDPDDVAFGVAVLEQYFGRIREAQT